MMGQRRFPATLRTGEERKIISMSSVQGFFESIMPKAWAEDMEAHSRSWMIRCPNCGFEQSVWDWGGIRWKAVGNPRTYLKCPNCGQKGWHVTYRPKDV